MLALADDAALARLVIAATAIPRRARLSWLRDIASRAENPSAQLAATPRHAPAATPCTCTASKLSDRAVESMPARPRTVTGSLICLGHRPSTAAATPCPSPAAVARPQARPSPRAVACGLPAGRLHRGADARTWLLDRHDGGADERRAVVNLIRIARHGDYAR